MASIDIDRRHLGCTMLAINSKYPTFRTTTDKTLLRECRLKKPGSPK